MQSRRAGLKSRRLHAAVFHEKEFPRSRENGSFPQAIEDFE